MPSHNCDICCQFADPVANAWMGHTTSQPAAGLVPMLKSAVMPAVASAITEAQSTAARSAGFLATPARSRALYDRASCMRRGAVRFWPLIHVAVAGDGSQSAAGPAGTGADQMAMAESMYPSAAVMTAR